MGNIIHNTRVVVAPSTSLPTRTFRTSYSYDSWDRIQSITYPDGEPVTYSYNLGGNIRKITGVIPQIGGIDGGTPYDYLIRADYDYFEQKTYEKFGDSTENFYVYTPSLHLLDSLRVRSRTTDVLGNNVYSYDKVGNITSISNSAMPAKFNGMGGSTSNTFTYDVLNRLLTASGSFTGDQNTQYPLGNDYSSTYGLSMAYSNTGRITTKTQAHNKNGVGYSPNTYTNAYDYANGNHTVSKITNTQNPSDPPEYLFYGSISI